MFYKRPYNMKKALYPWARWHLTRVLERFRNRAAVGLFISGMCHARVLMITLSILGSNDQRSCQSCNIPLLATNDRRQTIGAQSNFRMIATDVWAP
jgi:hypothetical protein